MKKLMTVVSVAATLLAFGAVNGDEVRTFTNTGFEDDPPYKAGELLSTTNDDNGLVAGESGFAATWVALPEGDDSENMILAYDAEGAEATPTGLGDVGSQYLHVESSANMLQRNVQPGGVAAAIGDGIYLDTLVKFTPADQPFVESDVADGDKIAISYVGQDPTEVAEGETPISNIVVRAGYVEGSAIVPTNYVMNLPDNADFDVNAWHRLTVRSIAKVGSSVAPVGFAIYIDGNPKPLTYASDVAAGDSAYVGALNAAVQTYLYNGEKHALLPSLVANGGTDFDKLTTVGFKGSGCVDNLAFTADPGFIEEGTAVEIAWDEGVATYTVVDSEGTTLVDGASTDGAVSTNLLLGTGITYLTVTATYATGYEADEWEVVGTGAEIDENGKFTVAEGAKLTIKAMQPKFDVGGVHYGTFADALDVAAGADEANMGTIKLLVDVVGDNEVSDGWVTIDLAGKTLTGVTDAAIINSGATLFITNSTAEIGHVAAAGDSTQAVLLTGGETTIYAGWFDGEVFVDSDDPSVLSVYGGYYLDENAAGAVGDFYLYRDNYVDDGVNVTYYGEDYFQVGESEPAELTLTIMDNENAESSVTINGDPAETGAVIKADDVIVITATAKSGYEYAQAPEGWTLSEGSITKTITVVDASVSVTIPAPVSEQSQEDWPEGEDLIAAEGKAAGDLFSGITNALATADAKAVATWAEANNVAYADKGSILPEAFLLNCANTQAAIDEAAANFKITAITVSGDTVTIAPADGADYGNGKVVIEGTATLSPISWHEKTDGDHFFRATLVVKPVTP